MRPTLIQSIEKFDKLSRSIGKHLAPWWSPHATPCWPGDDQMCMLVLLALADSAPDALRSKLARGFFLPLKWERRTTPDTRLPPSLLELAARVRAELGIDDDWQLMLWTMTTDPLVELDPLLSWDSAWTTLAAGLLVATQGGRMRRGILASAAFDSARKEVRGVKGLASKIEAIRRLRAGTPDLASPQGDPAAEVTLFVAASDVEEARDLTRDDTWLHIATYQVPASNTHKLSLPKLLEPHLDLLAVPPQEGGHKLLEWLNRATLSSRAISSYYEDVLPWLAQGVQERLPDSLRGRQVHTLLIAAGDQNTQQAQLLTLALRPERVVMTSVGKSGDRATAFHTWLTQTSPSTLYTHVPLPARPSREHVDALCAQLLAQGDTGEEVIVVDVTAGTRAMLWMMQAAAQRVGAQLTYIEHERQEERIVYGRETLLSYDLLTQHGL